MKRKNEYLYTKLSNILREQILTGFIKPGEFLLAENQLADYYEMSRVSVRRSLDTLVNEGLVVKRVGQGTMVAPNLVLPENVDRKLNILATSPSFYADTALNDIVDAFRTLYPKVKVNIISVPGKYLFESNYYRNNVKSKFDLVFIGDDQLKFILPEDEFQDLGHVFASSGFNEPVYKKIMEFFFTGNKLYAAPVTISTVFLAYNPGPFLKCRVEMPSENWTLEEFFNAAEKLTLDTNGDGIDDHFGFSISTTLTRWLTIALQNGVDFTRMADNKKKLERTLDFIHDLLYHRRTAVLFRNYSNMANPFYNQRAAMTLTTALELSGWDKHFMGFNPKVAKLPFENSNASILIANCMLVPEDSANSELAHSFVKLALNAGIQKEIAAKYKFLSVLKDVNSSVWNEDYLRSINVCGELHDGKFVNELFADSQVISGIHEKMETYWTGFDSAMITAQNLCDIILGT